MTADISFKITESNQKYRFNYRVAAIIEARGKILLHRFLDADFSFLPGGRVQLGETAEDALIRELAEELNITAQITSLPFIAENFFKYEDEIFHEMNLFFRVDGTSLELPADNEIKDGVEFLWRDGSNIAGLNLQPEFLQKELNHLPTTTKHIVNLSKNFRE